MVRLDTAQTGAPMPQDPVISLKNLLSASPTSTPPGQWGADSNTNLPKIAAVNIDIKWGTSPLHNRVLITNIAGLTTHTALGGARIRTEAFKSIQVWCDTNAAVTNKWLIEEEIKRIVMVNKLTLQSVGIDELIYWEPFQDIEVTEPEGDGDEVGRGGYLARSKCMVKLVYDEIVDTVN